MATTRTATAIEVATATVTADMAALAPRRTTGNMTRQQIVERHELRVRLMREWEAQGYSQYAIARALNMYQPAVSKELRRFRPSKRPQLPPLPTWQEIARQAQSERSA